MKRKPFEPNLRTPLEDQSKEEMNKRNSNGLTGNLYEDFRDDRADLAWETEQLAKSYGIYLEFNRAKSGREKDWMYMIRLGIPGGGPITPEQWDTLDDLANRYARDPEGNPSIRLTTRENVQFHWVKKEHLVDLIRLSAESGLLSLNGCGDNVRNVMACPFSHGSDIFDAHAWAAKAADYFRLPDTPFIQIFAVDPHAFRDMEDAAGGQRFQYGPGLLNRKFKIAFGAVHRNPETGELEPDNCTELRTHDMGIAPVIENNAVNRFQIYVGGGQGEKNGKPSASLLALPLATVTEDQLLAAMDAVVQVHQTWGDRANRHWARLKYVVKKQGIAWYRNQVQELLDFDLGDPVEDLDVGARHLHHGWTREPARDGAEPTYAFGAFIENGRLIDNSPNGRLKTMVREVAARFRTRLYITPNQDLVFGGIPAAQREEFEQALASYGFGKRHGKTYSVLRKQSGSCVGRDTCRLAYTESEKFEPVLIDELEGLGWGGLATSIGITGCERQCFRPATKAIGLVGSGNNRYQFKLFGTEDGRHQGVPLMDENLAYLKSVPRDQVPVVIDVLYRHYMNERRDGETVGYFNRRQGTERLIEVLKNHPKTAQLMEKPAKNLAVLV
ncbi:Nitrite and sulphite reductase 4Fe-4S domain-containing protein [Sulfidibacter corallicola]|uniref:Uncharacterized protein n=1 Tax=Sulfidibacter corallicola TaxID=2818388 RepID=A0A8A4TU83_SULCO|nr:hypothetical protein [Sulfidibacter corallicola]QTD53519.1 hypothetical protein J3U87_13775 [Sulfidibacter corallicola]